MNENTDSVKQGPSWGDNNPSYTRTEEIIRFYGIRMFNAFFRALHRSLADEPIFPCLDRSSTKNSEAMRNIS
jgi:hypothetical protein